MDSYESIDDIIEDSDIQGLVHNHSTWSDGAADIKTMALKCLELGYSYFGISDHSKSAFYAGGLSVDRVIAQWEEIERVNAELADKDIRILKGIESDILADGSLDYEDDILSGFDFIVASVHAHLRMARGKGNRKNHQSRLENPYTSILGHMTGRLLLSRQGYPLDHIKVIDACAANGVHIELNANPVRLDMDWSWIPYAQEKGVLISINPDAHSPLGLLDVQYGVISARKGLLTRDGCLNALTADEFPPSMCQALAIVNIRSDYLACKKRAIAYICTILLPIEKNIIMKQNWILSLSVMCLFVMSSCAKEAGHIN